MAKTYEYLESLVQGRITELENENARLKDELAITKAQLSVYERIASITGTKTSLGFGPPLPPEERS